MRIFSTFSGIGGFELGIIQAHKDKGLSAPEFVGYSETDRFASSVYIKHFKGVKKYGDIRKIKGGELPDFDCLVGGFPCQAFSMAGLRQGFKDKRGALFFDILRLLEKKRPRLFVLENVKGLLSHDNGRTFKTIVAALAELGYGLQWQVLDSLHFGVPQTRKRVIIIGHLGGTPAQKIFPLCPVANSPVRTCPQPDHDHQAMSVRIPEATKQGYRLAYVGDSVNLSYLSCRTKRGRIGRGIAHTLTASNMSQYTPCRNADGKLALRKFTPIECERLQGFPDDWTKYGKDGETISDTQRYKMCGNAVTVNIIRHVFGGLL